MIVIGAGVVGAFVARNLARYSLKTLVIEKDSDVGNETSMANSAIAHSGYDPLPGSKKAYFNRRGNFLLREIVNDLEVPYEENGSLTVAFDDEEVGLLLKLLERGKENKVDVRLVEGIELFKMEPHLNHEAKAALYAPTAGIINPFLLTSRAFENALDNGVELHLDEEVLSLDYKNKKEKYLIETNKAHYETSYVFDCAGLNSAKIVSFLQEPSFMIKPRKGEYYVFDHFSPDYIHHTLFPLPSKKGKGILVARTTSNNYLMGPSSEETSFTDKSTDKWTLEEVKKAGLRLVPSFPFQEMIRVFSGLRATPSTHDFIVEELERFPGFFVLGGIESPGLVSAPALGEYAVETLLKRRKTLTENPNYSPKVRHYLDLNKMSAHEREELLLQHPEYGEIVCVCEGISKGEILDIFKRSLPCKTLKALKKRTRVGFGKCQGGFCRSKTLPLLASLLQQELNEVAYDESKEAYLPYSKGQEK